MTDLVERVARVIDPEAFDPLPGHEQGRCIDCDGNRDEARRMARAAIEAMREMTSEMLDAAFNATNKHEGPFGRGVKLIVCRLAYESAITAALGEGGE